MYILGSYSFLIIILFHLRFLNYVRYFELYWVLWIFCQGWWKIPFRTWRSAKDSPVFGVLPVYDFFSLFVYNFLSYYLFKWGVYHLFACKDSFFNNSITLSQKIILIYGRHIGYISLDFFDFRRFISLDFFDFC